MRLTRRTALVGTGAALLAGCGTTTEPDPGQRPTRSATGGQSTSATPSPASRSTASGSIPELDVEVMADGLENPWGLGFLDDAVVFTERPGRVAVLRDKKVSPIAVELDVVATGEGGLTGLAVSPGFDRDRRIVVSHNSPTDIRVVPLTLTDDLRSATAGTPLVTGLPVNPSGRHSGCRPVFGPDQMLWIGTGDTARGPIPQDLDQLGGKVLRVHPTTGKPAPDNPWASDERPRALVQTYGHRNIQGLCARPSDGRMFAVEHGSHVDDEVNLLVKGANYGWNPVGQGEYDESVPMTDTSLPDAQEAKWSSGDSTLATSGACFVTGEQWGALDGALLVACLKAQRLLAMTVAADGGISEVRSLSELEGTHGRLRTVEQAPDGSIWVTTSNGSDDQLLRITPRP
ncbi:PQQ-dependent sugar dehydrogenase [Luteococcus sp. Sow4_B9]|uniref:PQQ-dependent sugar dehydrogenase n=1 Tax=Luteococcus sp. Sow4_B9 TaxID=3438792 RepID=UPI003F981113